MELNWRPVRAHHIAFTNDQILMQNAFLCGDVSGMVSCCLKTFNLYRFVFVLNCNWLVYQISILQKCIRKMRSLELFQQKSINKQYHILQDKKKIINCQEPRIFTSEVVKHFPLDELIWMWKYELSRFWKNKCHYQVLFFVHFFLLFHFKNDQLYNGLALPYLFEVFAKMSSVSPNKSLVHFAFLFCYALWLEGNIYSHLKINPSTNLAKHMLTTIHFRNTENKNIGKIEGRIIGQCCLHR